MVGRDVYGEDSGDGVSWPRGTATAEEVVAVAADPGYLPNCPATDPKRKVMGIGRGSPKN